MANSNLFEGGDYNHPKAPFEGMTIGTFSYKDSEIKKWIELYCLKNLKGCRLGPSSRGKRKVWQCTDQHCSWKVVTNCGRDLIW